MNNYYHIDDIYVSEYSHGNKIGQLTIFRKGDEVYVRSEGFVIATFHRLDLAVLFVKACRNLENEIDG